MTEISFGATFKSKTRVKKWVSNQYISEKGSIVKADHSDLPAITKTVHLWKRPYAAQIEQTLEMAEKNPEYKKEVYVLTSQLDQFEKLAPKKILGMVSVRRGMYENLVEYLQIRPDIEVRDRTTLDRIKDSILNFLDIPSSSPRAYKGVGGNIIKFLQRTLSDKPMTLAAANTSKAFYKQFGFIPEKYPHNELMTWTPPNLKKKN